MAYDPKKGHLDTAADGAYTPPSSGDMDTGAPNLCEFDTTTYTPPTSTAVDFDISAPASQPKQTGILGLKWSTSSIESASSKLNQKWVTNNVIKSTNKLNQKWSAPSIFKSTSELDQKWSVFIRVKDTNQLNQKWSVLLPTKATSFINQEWDVLLPDKRTSFVNQKWSTNKVNKTTSFINNKWITLVPIKGSSFINNKWSILIPEKIQSVLNQKWATTWGPFNSWSLVWSLKVSAQNTLLYGAGVNNQWSLPYSMGTLKKQWELPYNLSAGVNKQWDLKWDLDVGNDVVQQWSLLYSMGIVPKQWELPYQLNDTIKKQWNLPYSLTTELATQWSLDWDINTFDRVQNQFKLVYGLLDESLINITGNPTVTFGGENPDGGGTGAKNLSIGDAEIYTDEGGFVWQGTLSLLSIGDYKQFSINDPIILDFYGVTFKFIVESKLLDRSNPVDIGMSLRVISPAIKHDFPRAQSLTINYSTPVMAKATAESTLGESITWNIPDWEIPANRLGIADGSPIQLVKQIIEAVGGVLESNPDGTLVARSLFPVSVNKFDTVTVDQTYLDTTDNLSVTEEYLPQKLFNKFLIGDSSTKFADFMEYEPDEIEEPDGSTSESKTDGILKVFPRPFRENVVVKSSQDSSIGFELIGTTIEELEPELIEIIDGVGNLSKPIEELVSYTYHSTDLGTPTFVVGENQISTPNVNLKHGLIEVTYKTKFIAYDITGVHGKKVQWRLETV